MIEYQLTAANLNEVFGELADTISQEGSILVKVESLKVGKWGMARLWRAWMKTTAEWMASRGAKMPLSFRGDGSWCGERPFNQYDAHELFTAKWLCLNGSGERLSWSKNGRDGMRAATKGERFFAMQRHEEWSTNKGIMLFIPRDSEYKRILTETQR